MQLSPMPGRHVEMRADACLGVEHSSPLFVDTDHLIRRAKAGEPGCDFDSRKIVIWQVMLTGAAEDSSYYFALGRANVEAACHGKERPPACHLQVVPQRVCALHERHILRPLGIRFADYSAVAVR